MTARPGIPALLITLLLSIAFVVAACGDDGGAEVTDADYLTELFALDTEFSLQGSFLVDRFADRIATAGSEPVRVIAIREFSDEALDLFEQLLEDTKDLSATEELEDARERRIASLEAAKAAWKDVDDQLDDSESEAEMRTLLEQLFTSEAFAELSQPCFAELAIGIDIGCPEIDVSDTTPQPTDATPAATNPTRVP